MDCARNQSHLPRPLQARTIVGAAYISPPKKAVYLGIRSAPMDRAKRKAFSSENRSTHDFLCLNPSTHPVIATAGKARLAMTWRFERRRNQPQWISAAVGADAHIGPLDNVTNLPKCGVDTADFLWGDVGIAPYDFKYSGFSTTCGGQGLPRNDKGFRGKGGSCRNFSKNYKIAIHNHVTM